MPELASYTGDRYVDAVDVALALDPDLPAGFDPDELDADDE